MPSAREVAPRLLGKLLIRNLPEGCCGGMIVETEAYLVNDEACHGSVGLTQRNRVMFGPPGHAYVYFIYGVHYCVNAVCQPPGTAEAVLIRAIEPILGLDLMRARRNVKEQHSLTNGPGKLCGALGIDRGLDGCDLCVETGPVFIAEAPQRKVATREKTRVVTSRRIGITRAASLPLRFHIDGNPWVSPHRRPPL